MAFVMLAVFYAVALAAISIVVAALVAVIAGMR